MNPPSTATLAKIFQERCLVAPAPEKRPRSSYKRFRYPKPNACWQLDATEYTLEYGRKIVVFQLEVDYSRLMIASRAARSENSDDALKSFTMGVAWYGIPQRLLTDDGEALNPIHVGITSQLVAYANGLGVATITSRPGRPTTQWKNERVHGTLFERLNELQYASNLAMLQEQLDESGQHYNRELTHQALEGRCTPREVCTSLPVAAPPDIGYAAEDSMKARAFVSKRDQPSLRGWLTR